MGIVLTSHPDGAHQIDISLAVVPELDTAAALARLVPDLLFFLKDGTALFEMRRGVC